MPVSISGTNGVTFPDNSIQTAAASPFGLKNRIINGDMVVSQRFGTSSISAYGYTLDRWAVDGSQATRFTTQQNAGSVTPPAGFTNYLGITSTAATSLGAGDYFVINQSIEGFNVADLGWGAAGAATVTISFWVRSSLTGTFGGALRNGSANRSYPFSYTISAANTWTKINITIPGDTSGTWIRNNGAGLILSFSIGTGSTFSGTAGAWAGSNFVSATGAVSVVGTNGATFYVTGVQLERNTTATPFEWIPYGMELQLCQRYYATNYPSGIAPNGNAGLAMGAFFLAGNTTDATGNNQFPVVMRATPTLNCYAPAGGSGSNSARYFTTGGAVTSLTVTNDLNSVGFYRITGTFVSGGIYNTMYIASSEL